MVCLLNPLQNSKGLSAPMADFQSKDEGGGLRDEGNLVASLTIVDLRRDSAKQVNLMALTAPSVQNLKKIDSKIFQPCGLSPRVSPTNEG